MPKNILKILLGSVLLIATQACAPRATTPNPDVIKTSIAQTLAAIQTSGPGIPITGQESPTPTFSPVPTVTQTPTATLSPTPLFTSTAVVPQISVSVSTNCRVGPGLAYERVGGLLVGETAEVVGRDAFGDYWIIRNPDRNGTFCWLWGKYATVTGDTGALPLYTPPPTPTPAPNFVISYSGPGSCATSGNKWVELALENTGGITFRSLVMNVTDTVTGTNLSLYSDNFIDRDGCSAGEDQGDLDPGDTLIVSSPNFTYDPTGHRIRARVTVCSELGQSGTCRTQTFDFIP